MKIQWTKEKIKKGFANFAREYKRFPTAHEIDDSPHLPSSRYIQKKLGGLIALRHELGLKITNFSVGKNRSDIATAVGIAGKQLELDMEDILCETFGGQHVIAEQKFAGNYRVDFYVYAKKETFGVDVCHAASMRTLQSSVNIKMKKYQFFEQLLFLVVANPHISQPTLDLYKANKKNPLSEHIVLLSLSSFKKQIKRYTKIEAQD